MRRNYTLGVINGAILGFVDAIWAPSLVLAIFVAQLGGSNFLIGLLPAIYNGGWFLPQFLISHRVDRIPIKKTAYLVAGLVRSICLTLIVLATFVLGTSNPTLLLGLFFILYITFSLISGIAGNAFMTMVGKVIPRSRRGSYFGLRDLTGTATGVAAGLLISLVLNPQGGLAFPYNFGIIFILALVTVTVGSALIGLVVEPPDAAGGEGVTLRDQTYSARRVWRENEMFRRFLITRIALALADVATPFYAIYAIRQLGAPEQIVGLYIGLTTLSAMVTNPVWSWISDHLGNRPMLFAAAFTSLTMPFIAFVFGLFPHSPLLVTPFGLLFVFYGAGRTAGNIAFPTYLLEIAPSSERTLYIGLTNTLLGIATIIPAGGGILLDLFGFTPLFVISFLIGAVGMWLAKGLIEPQTASSR